MKKVAIHVSEENAEDKRYCKVYCPYCGLDLILLIAPTEIKKVAVAVCAAHYDKSKVFHAIPDSVESKDTKKKYCGEPFEVVLESPLTILAERFKNLEDRRIES